VSGILTFIFLAFTTQPFLSTETAIDQFQKETINYLDSDLDNCLFRINQSITASQDLDYDYGEAYGLYLKAYVHRTQDDLGKAFVVNLKALSILNAMMTSRAIDTKVRLYLNSGEILKKHFKYDEAIQYYKEGLEIAQNNNLENWVIDLQYNIGNAYRGKGDLSNAFDYIHRAYTRAIPRDDEHTVVNALNIMGLIFKDNGSHDTARFYFQKMLTYDYHKLNENKYRGRAYHNIANTYGQVMEYDKAEVAFKKALNEKRIKNRPKEVFITEIDLAELYHQMGRLEDADRLAKACVSKYDHIGLDPDYYKIFDLQRKISSDLERFEELDFYANRYVEESTKFVAQQEELIRIRDQFKMEILTASFFVELERNNRISYLNQIIIMLLMTVIVILLVFKCAQVLSKRSLEKEIKRALGKTP